LKRLGIRNDPLFMYEQYGFDLVAKPKQLADLKTLLM